MPHYPLVFDIPDEWIDEAGFKGFRAKSEAFRLTPDAIILPLTAIEPVARFVSVPKDRHGFDRARLVSVMRGIISDVVIDPIPVAEVPFFDRDPSPYKYRVRDGYHRFYASIAAGFSGLPTSHD